MALSVLFRRLSRLNKLPHILVENNIAQRRFQSIILCGNVQNFALKALPQHSRQPILYSNLPYCTKPVTGTIVQDYSDEEEAITKDVLLQVNKHIKEETHGRLFAIIHVLGKQFKVTAEDIIAVPSDFPGNIGERIRLEKVMLVGSKDFTLIGRPLLSKDLVRIDATVLEKTFSHAMPQFRKLKRTQTLRWFRIPFVLLRINSIEFNSSVDISSVEGIQNRIF